MNSSDVAQNTQIIATVHSTCLASRAGTVIAVCTTKELPPYGPLFFEPGTDLLQFKDLTLPEALWRAITRIYSFTR